MTEKENNGKILRSYYLSTTAINRLEIMAKAGKISISKYLENLILGNNPESIMELGEMEKSPLLEFVGSFGRGVKKEIGKNNPGKKKEQKPATKTKAEKMMEMFNI